MNPGRRKSGTSTESSVDDAVKEETVKLIQLVNEGGDFGTRKQEALKALVRIHSSWSHTFLFIAVPSSHLDVMGICAC